MTPSDEFDEFHFLESDAARWGISSSAPPPRRVETVALGERISALRWGERPSDYTFLHGAGLNAHTWDTTLLALGASALAIELPGHGDSAWREDFRYDPRSLADVVATAAEQLGCRGSVLVGHSLGGLTAAVVAARNPDLFSALVVIDISPGRSVRRSSAGAFMAGPESFASREEVLDRAVEFKLGPTRDSLRRGVYLNTRVRDDGRVVFKHHFGNRPPGAPPAYTDITPIWSDLEALRIPVMLIAGEHGVLTEENVTEFQDRLPESSVVLLDAGHNVQHDQPIELAAVVGRFRASLEDESRNTD